MEIVLFARFVMMRYARTTRYDTAAVLLYETYYGIGTNTSKWVYDCI